MAPAMTPRTFDSVLIANRGEIACRIARTARTLGLRVIAVYSDADAHARHVALADEAYLIGPAPAAQSYLNIEAVLDAARNSGAQAVHPGYGFLSENADFADACADAGLVFIGPPAAAMRAMGLKDEAKRLMAQAGIPVVPGFDEDDLDGDAMARAATDIGYPVLIKAVAGGGGRGMRLVRTPDEFAAALDSARREAEAAFGEPRVLVEKYLTTPRHIEVQVFADTHGNAVHLFERDCSIQRRHQKVVEEAPAPGLPADLRRRMGEAAVAAARAIDYVGAGTVEFIVDAGGPLEDAPFYFMEMNTRLQVEHPVTEMITGEDLVAWQFRVAMGEALPRTQDEIACAGHAIEVRLYAEDPTRDFLPAAGRLACFRLPPEDAQLRVETGLREGDDIPVHYDPLIAKLIVRGETRDAALARLRAALKASRIAGTPTNLAFLLRLAEHPAFAAAALETGFIAAHREALIPAPEASPARIHALGALYVLLRRRAQAKASAARSSDPWSPWHRTDGWRLNDRGFDVLRFVDASREVSVHVTYRADGFELDAGNGPLPASGVLKADGELTAELDGVRLTATVIEEDDALTILTAGEHHVLHRHDPRREAQAREEQSDRIVAPMPGKVIAVAVEPGERVGEGAPLIVLEAMKMEHLISAPGPATVAEVHVNVGDQIEDGAVLITFGEPGDDEEDPSP